MTWILALAFVNIIAATIILYGGTTLARSSKSKVANLVLVMFICIALEIVAVTIALFIPVALQMPVRFFARCIELCGVLYFGLRLANISVPEKDDK